MCFGCTALAYLHEGWVGDSASETGLMVAGSMWHWGTADKTE